MDLLKQIFKGDRGIWAIFLALCMISIMEVFSATSTLTYNSGNYWAPIQRHTLLLLAGIGIIVLIHNIHYKWFRVLQFILLPISAFLLILVMVMGQVDPDSTVNGSARFLSIAGIPFQPSEFAKMALVIFTANIMSRFRDEEGASSKAFWWILVATGIICLLIFPENFSTAMLLGATIFCMMFIGRVPWKHLLGLSGSVMAAAVLFVGFLLVTPEGTLDKIPMGHRFTTWKHRIENFTQSSTAVPAAKFDIDNNRQYAFGQIAIAKSGIIGKGPGNSVQRDFLSQAYSDFIYAIIIEELGLLGGALVVVLYIWLLIRAGKIANKCDRTFPAFLVLGISLLLVIQAAYNMGVAVDIFPITGQPLPLVSRGGTSILVNCTYIGMILSVSRYTAKIEEKKLLESLQKEEATQSQESELEYLQQEKQEEETLEPDMELTNQDSEFS